MDSKNLQIDYEGTEFDEPEILPDISEKNFCNGEEHDNGGNNENGNGDTNGNLLLKAELWHNSGGLLSPNPLLMYSAYAKDSENADR